MNGIRGIAFILITGAALSVQAATITFPTAGMELYEGREYILTGQGTNLSWQYDGNSDGLGPIDIGTGESVAFTIPTGIKSPREIIFILTGDGGTGQVTCSITDYTGDPVVSAGGGTVLVLPDNSAILHGSADDDGTITTWSWTKQSGPSATLANASTADLSLSDLVEGTYIVRLTVTDNDGNTTYDDATVSVYAAGSGEGTVSGDLKVWHTLSVSFMGPQADEASVPNPFLDYRLQVLFTGPSGQTYNVPGFFDGNGIGSGTGNIWKVLFTPDEAGDWTYYASFKTGTNVAISTDPAAGSAAAFDGAGGSFVVASRDAAAPGNLAKGRLLYVNNHYLQWSDGSYYIKGGCDSPENFLAYAGFDATTYSKFTLHNYAAHAADWNTDDPDWNGGKGKGIIGALNYLAAHKVNSIYVMPMNIGGDGQDCWPFAGSITPSGSSSNENLRYDISKLYQWEIMFDHAEKKGMLIHMVLNEAERNNKNELDNATLGTERKLYYREMAARFGHHLALQWNLCEEYNLGLAIAPSMILSWANYLAAVDPYGHPIAVHHSHGITESYTPFLGSRIDMMSIQVNDIDFGAVTEEWRTKSADADKKWPVMFDEFDRCGKTDDESHNGSWPNLSGHAYIRKHILWPVLFSGGGVEYILQDLLDTENFRPYESMWDYTWYARKFMEENLPFWEMEPDDGLVTGESTAKGGAQVMVKSGKVYAVYLPEATTTGSISLAAGTYTKRWYNPRTGAFEGSGSQVSGGSVAIGNPPSSSSEDWAVLFTETGYTGISLTGTDTHPETFSGKINYFDCNGRAVRNPGHYSGIIFKTDGKNISSRVVMPGTE